MDVGQYFNSLWRRISGWVGLSGSMGLADIIDILIVAFIIYQVIQFLMRSRLAMIAKSIAFLVAVVWLSGRFGLKVINFATSTTLQLGILALVILFQPEIRQILERIGRSSLTGLFGREIDEQEIEAALMQTVIACTQMARDKTGALIVFERNVSLEDELKTGTRVDARVSSELLKNVFFNKAPLHDGAVIIRDGKLTAGGCMLPLSDNANLSRDLGMRHRAGIGISEKSDAVTVIVSEETGSISVAVEGMLKRHLAQDTLEKLLRNELITEQQERRRTIFQWLYQWLFKGRKNEKTR